MEIRFRAASASDAERVVPFIYSAGPEAFEYIFTEGRRSAHDFLHYTFPAGDGMFGWRNHAVAETADGVLGVGAFYSGIEYPQLSRDLALQILRFYGLHSPMVLRRALQTKHWMAPPPRRMLYVANLGVAPASRGMGVGAALLKHQLEQARSQGKQIYALDVADNNSRAQQLYERIGLRVVRETPFPHTRNGVALPAARRMELAL